MYSVPVLFQDFRDGVPGLLSAEGFDMAWTQYMELLMFKLNALIASTKPNPMPPAPFMDCLPIPELVASARLAPVLQSGV